MGCDIHCYIEYKRPTSDHWSDFGGRINPGRNYDIFSKLAGVRNYDEVEPVAEPRGFPEDASYAAKSDYWLYASNGSGEGCCTKETAERWVNTYPNVRYRNSEKTFVSNPDWHTHSWLTTAEYAKVVEEYDEPEYHAILAAMRSFEAGGYQARLVFWFDN